MRVVLISTYELGHQPFGLASPAAWLREAGHMVDCADLSCERLPDGMVAAAGMVAFYLPMHTATRLAVKVLPRVRVLNPKARLCAYGLYAPMNADLLRSLGVETIIGGEFEQGLVDAAAGLATPLVSLGRQHFRVPDRTGLPPLDAYARLEWNGASRRVGYTEASRGCKHRCRHCPIVPVYDGVFRVVARDVVLEDIRRQVAAGAGHITFGDPDFFNGPSHAVALVEALHAEFPELSYDVTVKVEHLLKHRELLPALRRTGCLFVTSAVESADDAMLARLEKGHTRADFVEVAQVMRDAGLTLAPTFVPFTPWSTWEGHRDLLALLVELDLVEHVAPIQLAIRLLIPAGSRLLELPGIDEIAGPFDPALLAHSWRHRDASLDELARALQEAVKEEERRGSSRRRTFARIWELAKGGPLPPDFLLVSRATIPYLTEPWFC